MVAGHRAGGPGRQGLWAGATLHMPRGSVAMALGATCRATQCAIRQKRTSAKEELGSNAKERGQGTGSKPWEDSESLGVGASEPVTECSWNWLSTRGQKWTRDEGYSS